MTLDRTNPPKVSPFSDIKLPEEKVEILPNGIVFHYVDVGEQPISRLGVYWEGGFLDYPDKASAAVLAEAFREQTANYSSDSIADIIDYNGARLSSRSAEHYTALELVALNSRLPDLLPLIASMATESVFDEHHVGVIARKLSAARAVQLSKVAFIAAVEMRRFVQGKNHPASKLVLPQDYENVTPETLASLYADQKQARMHVFLGGALGEKTVNTVRNFLHTLPGGDMKPLKIEPYLPEPLTGDSLHIEMPQSQQSAVVMGLPTIDRSNPDYIALRLAVTALGGYFGSRLMHNIREEKGLTYGISAALLGSREGAFMEINAQCDASGVEQLIEESIKEIRLLASNPPAGDELHRLRQFAWSQLAASADSSFGILDHYITHLLVATPDDYFSAQLDAIDTLSPKRIAEVAEKYLNPDNLRIVTCGR